MPAPDTGAARDASRHLSTGGPPRPQVSGAATRAGAPTLRGTILVHLRRNGACSPEQLATALGASRTGVLQQLRALEAAGLVDRRTVRHGVGRPRHLYDITPAAQSAFPTNYDALAAGLLAAIGTVGGDELVSEVFDIRRHVIANQVRHRLAERLPADASLEARVRELAVIQDEQGYLSNASIGPDGIIRLHECNCAIYGIAIQDASPCEAELAMFRDVLGAEVVRESHIASGDRTCTYRVVGQAD